MKNGDGEKDENITTYHRSSGNATTEDCTTTKSNCNFTTVANCNLTTTVVESVEETMARMRRELLYGDDDEDTYFYKEY
jgi:hypothetical protein